jgi:hypothetical protein
MIRPRDVPDHKINRAKEFVRKPFSDGFKAWTTLRDRDNVTMTIQELGHLMAWYAEVVNAGQEPNPRQDGNLLELPKTLLPAPNAGVSGVPRLVDGTGEEEPVWPS